MLTGLGFGGCVVLHFKLVEIMSEVSKEKATSMKPMMRVLEDCLHQCQQRQDWAGQAAVCARLGTMFVDILPNGRFGKQPSFEMMNCEKKLVLGQMCQCQLSKFEQTAEQWFSQALDAAERHLAQRKCAHADESGKEGEVSSMKNCSSCLGCSRCSGGLRSVLRTKTHALLHLARLRYMAYLTLPVCLKHTTCMLCIHVHMQIRSSAIFPHHPPPPQTCRHPSTPAYMQIHPSIHCSTTVSSLCGCMRVCLYVHLDRCMHI